MWRRIPVRSISANSALFLPAFCAFFCALQTPCAAQTDTSTPEVFEAIDPYTKARPELIERAGYVSLGPFQIAQSIETKEVEEVLGGLRVLWVETAHFKLGSLLQTYRRVTDDFEEKKLAEELARLAKKLPRVRKDVREIDPWLRLHLYAQRLEEQYADFQTRVGVTDATFAAKPASAPSTGPNMGSGPYLGLERKFVVLITEQKGQLQRFARRWIGPQESSWYRKVLPGGAWFFGTSAQSTKEMGTKLDSALHAMVAAGLTYELCDGFRGGVAIRPLWFKHGLGLVYGRKAEPRWCVFVQRDSPEPDDQTWRFEERLNGLVANKFVAGWDEMLAWKDGAEFEARHHMTMWSRVAWLAETDPTAFRTLAMRLSDPPTPSAASPTDDAGVNAGQVAAVRAAYGKTTADLDESWRKWVLKKYPKK